MQQNREFSGQQQGNFEEEQGIFAALEHPTIELNQT
jgi:hypothetical protein